MENESIKLMGRIIANSFYETQQIRISTMSRIRDVIRKKIEGIPFDQVEEKKQEDDENEKSYTDEELLLYLKELLDKNSVTQQEYDYVLRCIEIAKESRKIENKYKKAMEEYVITESIYNRFLKDVRGIGIILSANLIKEFGYCENIIFDKKEGKVIGRETGDKKEFEDALKLYNDERLIVQEEYRYSMKGYSAVSKIWSHTGYTSLNGVAPRRRKGENVHFSPRLRTLLWKCSDCLMKSNKGLYRQIYTTEKQVQLAKTYPEGKLFELYGKPYKSEDTKLSKGHAHNRALRKIGQLFLSHYWACAREIKGLPTRSLYVQEKLGHTNIITWKKVLEMEK